MSNIIAQRKINFGVNVKILLRLKTIRENYVLYYWVLHLLLEKNKTITNDFHRASFFFILEPIKN